MTSRTAHVEPVLGKDGLDAGKVGGCRIMIFTAKLFLDQWPPIGIDLRQCCPTLTIKPDQIIPVTVENPIHPRKAIPITVVRRGHKAPLQVAACAEAKPLVHVCCDVAAAVLAIGGIKARFFNNKGHAQFAGHRAVIFFV